MDMTETQIRTGNMSEDLYSKMKNGRSFFLIAGPCVIEDEVTMMQTAEFLKREAEQRHLTLIFKASFQKANRTSPQSYRGPGLDKGLRLLQKIRDSFQTPILTDVHECSEVSPAAEICDVLQIPAFLSRQTSLIECAGLSGKIVNIKKGQFMAPEDMGPAAMKVASCGNDKILLTERGTTFGYHDLVVDFRSFSLLQQLGYPVVYDVTHSLQQPSISTQSGGRPELAPMMAAAAIATGCVNGLFIETHPEPGRALSDAASMIPLEYIPALLERCLRLQTGKD